MASMQTKGFGSSRKPKQTATVPPYCISPQLAPPMMSPSAKKLFAGTEDYHTVSAAKPARK